LKISWTLTGTQTSKVTLSILEVLSRHETIINDFVNLSKGSEIWKINVNEGEYEFSMYDDQNMMLVTTSEIFKIYPASGNDQISFLFTVCYIYIYDLFYS
jgi:hypothetical protein